MSQLLEIFKNRSKIWEGLRNKVFKDDHVEAVYNYRLSICKTCKLYDESGKGCAVVGTAPCCNKEESIPDEIAGTDTKGCGCSLSLKARSLASWCPAHKWTEVVNQQEEDMIRSQILNTRLNETKN